MRAYNLMVPWFVFLSVLCIGGMAFPRGISGDVMTLDMAYGIAVEGNPDLATARSRIVQARERIKQAEAASWPRLDSSFSMNVLDEAENLKSPGTATEDPVTVYDGAVGVSWNLFDGFKRRYDTAVAELGFKRSGASCDNVKRVLLGSVATSFYAAQLARKRVAIAQADEEFNLLRLKEAEAKLDAGTGSKSDVLNFMLRVNTARSARVNAERVFTRSMTGLAEVMGIEGALFPPGVSLVELPRESEKDQAIPDFETCFKKAEGFRPDLQERKLSLDQAELGIKTARSFYYPNLNFEASVFSSRKDSPHFTSDDTGGRVILSTTWNIFAGGLHRAMVAEAVEGVAESRSSLASLDISIKSEIRKALNALKAVVRQLELQRESERLVRQNRELVEMEYKAGQASLVRLNEAQNDLVNAESSLALALVDLYNARSSLETVTGEILEGY